MHKGNGRHFVAVTKQGVTRGYKDGLQPETLADGNWLVKQNQPVSKIENKILVTKQLFQCGRQKGPKRRLLGQ